MLVSFIGDLCIVMAYNYTPYIQRAPCGHYTHRISNCSHVLKCVWYLGGVFFWAKTFQETIPQLDKCVLSFPLCTELCLTSWGHKIAKWALFFDTWRVLGVIRMEWGLKNIFCGRSGQHFLQEKKRKEKRLRSWICFVFWLINWLSFGVF